MQIREKRTSALAFLFFALIAPTIRFPLAQSAGRTAASVAVYRLESSGTADATLQIITDLLFSFMGGMNISGAVNYNIDFINSTYPEALANGSAERHKAAYDYMLHGTLSTVPDGTMLELFLTGKNPGNSRAVSRTYSNPNRLMLGIRLLVRELFESPNALAAEVQVTTPEMQRANANALRSSAGATHFTNITSVDSLAGNWSGDAGIERIMILRGGRGAAVFSNGYSLMLALSVQDGVLAVMQSGKPSPLQFPDLPAPVAEKAAERAGPLQWRFLVSEDGSILAGEKSTVQVNHDGRNIISMERKIEKATWTRN